MRIQVAGHFLDTISDVADELELAHQEVLDAIQSGELDAGRVTDRSLRVEEAERRRFAQVLQNKKSRSSRSLGKSRRMACE